MKKTFKIQGMTCNSCAQRIEDALKEKVNSIDVSFSKEHAVIDFDPMKISGKKIIDTIKEAGYDVVVEDKIIENALDKVDEKKETLKQAEQEVAEKIAVEVEKEPLKKEIASETTLSESGLSNKIGWGVMIGSVIALFVVLYYVLNSLGIEVQIPTLGEKTGLFLLFFVGILTGFHCIAMCGGFVVGYTTKNAIKGHKSYKQHLVYGGSKLISYAVIGGIFGLIGGVFAFSIGLRGFIAIFAGAFMIFYAFNMFGFKFFRKFQFNPKFLTKATASASKHAKGPFKAPFITGMLSGLFIACGPLQAMYLYAMGTGSILSGTISLAAFGLGTLPVMIGFGSVATSISHKATRKILKISAIIVLVLGLIMLNRGLTVMGSPVSYDSVEY
jgi:sulfite exporter TauE/SafE/copper chaperone CopZ